MGDKTKQVGGGTATGVGNDFMKFLQDGLSTGQFGKTAGTKFGSKFGQGSNQTTAADAMTRTNPLAKAQGMGGAIDNMLNGGPPTPQYGVDTAGLSNLAGEGFSFDKFNPASVDFSTFNTNGLKGFDSGLGGFQGGIGGNQQFQQMLQQMGAAGPNVAGQGPGNFAYGATDLSPYTAALDRAKMLDKADLRARFGAAGGMAFGTPAAFAEGNFDAATNAANASTLADITMRDRQSQLGAGQLNSQNSIANLQAMLQGNAQNMQGKSTALSALGSALGQDQGDTLQAMISKGQLDLNALSQATGFDLESLKAASAQGLSLADLMNQNQGMQANSQLGNKNANANILQSVGQLGLQGQQLGQNFDLAKMNLSSDMIGKLLQTFMGASQLGIPQAQIVQQKGLMSNITDVAKGVAGVALGGFKNPFGGGGGGNTAVPQFNMPTLSGIPNKPFGSGPYSWGGN